MQPRTRLFLLVLALLALLSPVLADLAEQDKQLFAKFDEDKNGSLSSTEIGSFPWKRYDSNRNGAVTLSEFLAGRKKDRELAKTLKDPAEAFEILDWNNDNALSGTELDEGMWSKYDRDGDNWVTKGEFITGRTAKTVDAKPTPRPPKPPIRKLPGAMEEIPTPRNAPDLKGDWAMLDSGKGVQDPANPLGFTITQINAETNPWSDGWFLVQWDRAAGPERGYYKLSNKRAWFNTRRHVGGTERPVQYSGRFGINPRTGRMEIVGSASRTDLTTTAAAGGDPGWAFTATRQKKGK